MNAYLQGDFTSIPNGTVMAGELTRTPQPLHVPGTPAQPHHAEIQQPGSSNGSGDAPTSGSADDSSDDAPAPITSGGSTGGSSGGSGGGNTGGGGGVHVPGTPVTVPPLPSTSVGPVDEVLTFAQATAQCLLDGFVDNPLVNNDPFDQCVHDYMN